MFKEMVEVYVSHSLWVYEDSETGLDQEEWMQKLQSMNCLWSLEQNQSAKFLWYQNISLSNLRDCMTSRRKLWFSGICWSDRIKSPRRLKHTFWICDSLWSLYSSGFRLCIWMCISNELSEIIDSTDWDIHTGRNMDLRSQCGQISNSCFVS